MFFALLIGLITTSNAQSTDDKTSCWAGSNCTSGDFIISKIYLSDAIGNPLTSTFCSSPGTVVDVYLAIEFTNNTSSDRNGIFLSGTISSNSTTRNIAYCFNEILPKKRAKVVVAPDKFEWTCGKTITLENGFTGWNSASGPVCIEGCSGTTKSKCRSYPSQVIQSPLVADYSFAGSCPNGAAYQTLSFTNSTTGGTTPYTYKWEYSTTNDANSVWSQFSTLANPTWSPNNATSYYIRLTVSDKDGQQTDSEVKSGVNAEPCCTTPVVGNQTPAAFCSPGSVTLSASDFTGTNTIPTGTTYSWSAPSAPGITGLASGSNASSFSTGTLTNTTSSTINVVYTVTPKSGACTGNSFTITVSVKPTPNAPTVTAGPFCSIEGKTISDLPQGSGAYKYYIAQTGGSPLAGATLIPVGTNTYYVSTTSNDCESSRSSVSVTVTQTPDNPTASITTLPTCENANGTVTVSAPLGSEYEYSNNNGDYQDGTTFTVAAGASYSIKVRRKESQCVSTGAASGTMDDQPSETPAPKVEIISNVSCASSTGILKIVIASSGEDYNNSIYEFSDNGTTYTDNPEFSFTAGAGYNLYVRKISDPTCVASITCQGEANRGSNVRTSNQQKTYDVAINLNPVTKVTAAPNPFNDRIRFTLKSDVSGQGTLELYNTLGQKVKTVFQGQVKAGQVQTIEYVVPSAQRTNLIYLFRVGDQTTTGKLVGLKQ
jgi:hypothetical protein